MLESCKDLQMESNTGNTESDCNRNATAERRSLEVLNVRYTEASMEMSQLCLS